MGTLLQDLRYGARLLARSPGFTLIAIITLALGIGANTAIFTAIDAYLLSPPPFPDADRLVVITEAAKGKGLSGYASLPSYLDWKEQSQSFERLGAYQVTSEFANLSGVDEPERLSVARVTSAVLPTLGVQSILGRWFLPDEDKPGANRVVILSEGLWKRILGGRRDLAGQTVRLGGKQYLVVGILPASLRFTPFEYDAWLPLIHDPASREYRTSFFVQVIGKLKPGYTIDQARAEIAAIYDRIKHQDAQLAGWSAVVESFHERLVEGSRARLLLLLAAVALVLLIACANIANLLLARAASREKEMAIRAALGAAMASIVRQLLTESMLLALIGGALGLLIAHWSAGLLSSVLFGVSGTDAEIYAGVVLFLALIALLACYIPARRATKVDPMVALGCE